MDAIRKIEVVVWRCFHCDEAFTDEAAARDHFGRSERQSPVCQIDATEYRKMEARMLSYNEEDSEMHRQIYRMESSHAAALKAEEEKGYARGLADGAPYLAEREAVIATHTQTLASKEAELVRLRTDASRAPEVVRAEPVAQQFYCNKCGYIGRSAVHPGCDYDASQRVPVALPQEPVAWKWEVLPDTDHYKRKGPKEGVYLENPAALGIPMGHPAYQWTPLYTAPPSTAPAQSQDHLANAESGGVQS